MLISVMSPSGAPFQVWTRSRVSAKILTGLNLIASATNVFIGVLVVSITLLSYLGHMTEVEHSGVHVFRGHSCVAVASQKVFRLYVRTMEGRYTYTSSRVPRTSVRRRMLDFLGVASMHSS